MYSYTWNVQVMNVNFTSEMNVGIVTIEPYQNYTTKSVDGRE